MVVGDLAKSDPGLTSSSHFGWTRGPTGRFYVLYIMTNTASKMVWNLKKPQQLNKHVSLEQWLTLTSGVWE